MIYAKVVFKQTHNGKLKPSVIRPFSMYSDIKQFTRANRGTVLKVVDREGVRL